MCQWSLALSDGSPPRLHSTKIWPKFALTGKHLSPMIRCASHHALRLIVGACLVHGAYLATLVPERASAATGGGLVGADSGVRAQVVPVAEPKATGLPAAVEAMRDAILEAVQTGEIEDLKVALDLNELKPELAAEAVPDPVAFWRKASNDGTGRDILASLGTLFELPHTIQPLGQDPENTGLYIWPAFADRPLAELSPEENAQLARLEPPETMARMKAAGRYTGWRLVIGADGVWHSFRRYD